MAAKDHLNTKLFHGTGGEIVGGVVHPGEKQLFGPGAYATTVPSLAILHAERKAREQGRLFGMVYEVEPVSEAIPAPNEGSLRDEKGFKVLKHVASPIVVDEFSHADEYDNDFNWKPERRNRPIDIVY